MGIAEFVHDRAVLSHHFIQPRNEHQLRGVRTFQQCQYAAFPRFYIGITLFDTCAIRDLRPLCTCIALLNRAFQHYRELESSERWTESQISWKKLENIDQ